MSKAETKMTTDEQPSNVGTKTAEQEYPVIVRLKCGEYDGADIMTAWLTLADLFDRNKTLETENRELRKRIATVQRYNAAEVQQEKFVLFGPCEELVNWSDIRPLLEDKQDG